MVSRQVRATSGVQPSNSLANSGPVDRSSYLHHNHGGGYHSPVLAPNTYTLNLVGTLGLALVIGVIIYDFIAYLFAVYRNTTDSYSPYGRRVASIATDLWSKKTAFEGISPYLSARSLEPLNGVLDAIAAAVQKFEDPQEEQQGVQGRQAGQQQQQQQQQQQMQQQQQQRKNSQRTKAKQQDFVFKE